MLPSSSMASWFFHSLLSKSRPMVILQSFSDIELPRCMIEGKIVVNFLFRRRGDVFDAVIALYQSQRGRRDATK